jgi:hypothetical protein
MQSLEDNLTNIRITTQLATAVVELEKKGGRAPCCYWSCSSETNQGCVMVGKVSWRRRRRREVTVGGPAARPMRRAIVA